MKKTKSLILVMAMGLSFLFTACFNLSDLFGVEDSGGTDSLEISQEESESKMQELAANDGYEITSKLKWDSSDEEEEEKIMTWGSKDDCVWAILGTSGYAYKKEGNSIICYEATRESNGTITYSYQSTLDSSDCDIDDTFDSLKSSTNIYLYWTNTYDGQLKKTGTSTIAGRNCTHYTYGTSTHVLGVYAGTQYDLHVDNETGITMKVYWEANSSEGNASYYHEITSFKTGNSVQLPSLPSLL